MGQCSTLPADSRPSPSTSTTSVIYEDNNRAQSAFRKNRLSEEGRRESLDFNVIVTPEPTRYQTVKDSNGPLVVLRPVEEVMEDTQTRDQEEVAGDNDDVEDMEIDSRDQAPPAPPPLPEGALRTRCYKLNLDSDAVSLSSTQRQQVHLGPFTEPPPHLTYSSSADSSEGINPVLVAIKTAQIFRGITVGRDGTILSQNARATRSNRGNKSKKGEKSRQAAKIDKAKDLVEESMASAKEKGSVSLVIMGQYDDMKMLVRDGSKKLRDADGLPDKTLLSLNLSRAGSSKSAKRNGKSTKSISSTSTSSRKRASASPNFVSGQRSAAMAEPMQIAHAMSPPKLKGHPRDNRPTRREDRTNMRLKMESVHDYSANNDTHFSTPTHHHHHNVNSPMSNNAGGQDWSHAWNIWNCVGSGAVSPLQPSSPQQSHKVAIYEGRESAYANVREGGTTGRAS